MLNLKFDKRVSMSMIINYQVVTIIVEEFLFHCTDKRQPQQTYSNNNQDQHQTLHLDHQ